MFIRKHIFDTEPPDRFGISYVNVTHSVINLTEAVFIAFYNYL